MINAEGLLLSRHRDARNLKIHWNEIRDFDSDENSFNFMILTDLTPIQIRISDYMMSTDEDKIFENTKKIVDYIRNYT